MDTFDLKTAQSTPAYPPITPTSGVGGGGGGSWGDGTASTPSFTYTGVPYISPSAYLPKPTTSTKDTTTGSQTTSGDTTDMQTQIDAARAEAERIQGEINNLQAKDASAADNIVVSDTPIVTSEEEAMDQIKASTRDVSREAIDLLDAEIARIQSDMASDINAINTTFDALKTGTLAEQKSETGQTSMGIAGAGGYLGFSGSGTGVMLNLAKSHRDELASLAAKRQQAIADARAAAAGRRFDLVRLKADEIARIDQEVYNREQDYFNNKLKLQNEVTNRSQELKVQQDIFSVIDKGITSPQDIFKQMGGTATIDEINSFLDGLVPESAATNGFKFTTTNTAKLLGAGMGQDDITALTEYVNENGYDDTVRAAMTPSQRAVADKIFLDMQNTTGTTDATKVMSLLDLQRIKEEYDVSFPPGVTAGVVNEFIQDNWGESPAKMQEAINVMFGGDVVSEFGGGGSIEYTKDYFQNTLNLTTSQLKSLADLTGASSVWTGKEKDIDRMFADPDFLNILKQKVQTAKSALPEFSEIEIITSLIE